MYMQDLDKIRREFDSTQAKLQDLKQSYIKRRDTMRQQVPYCTAYCTLYSYSLRIPLYSVDCAVC